MDLMSKQIKVVLLSLVSVVLIALCFSGKMNKWYVVDYDFDILKEIEINVFTLSDCRLDVRIKNDSSMSYNLSPIVYSIEKMRNGRWMYWAEEPLGERTITDNLLGRAIRPNVELNFEVNLRDYLPCPVEPGTYRITFFFVSDLESVYQSNAYFVLK